MLTTSVAFVVGAAVVCAFQTYVSLRLLRSPAYALGQKARQLVVVWLLPLFGAIIVYLVVQSDSIPRARRDTAFTAADDGIGPGLDHG